MKFEIELKTCVPPLVASEGGSLWVVSGRIPHADEDTTFAILADDEQQACDAFEEALWEGRDPEKKPEVIMEAAQRFISISAQSWREGLMCELPDSSHQQPMGWQQRPSGRGAGAKALWNP